MKECVYCQHVEMCGWREDTEGQGCEFFDDGNKWIPVSMKLPEDRCAVLVWCPERKNTYCAYLEKEQWWIFGAFGQIVPNEVIAWMPLPKRYEPQESEG